MSVANLDDHERDNLIVRSIVEELLDGNLIYQCADHAWNAITQTTYCGWIIDGAKYTHVWNAQEGKYKYENCLVHIVGNNPPPGVSGYPYVPTGYFREDVFKNDYWCLYEEDMAYRFAYLSDHISIIRPEGSPR